MCSEKFCGGSLVSLQVVLSAYHCVEAKYPDETIEKGKDFRGTSFAILGAHEIDQKRLNNGTTSELYKKTLYTIQIKKALWPDPKVLDFHDNRPHDFALLVLKESAVLGPKVQ